MGDFYDQSVGLVLDEQIVHGLRRGGKRAEVMVGGVGVVIAEDGLELAQVQCENLHSRVSLKKVIAIQGHMVCPQTRLA